MACHLTNISTGRIRILCHSDVFVGLGRRGRGFHFYSESYCFVLKLCAYVMFIAHEICSSEDADHHLNRFCFVSIVDTALSDLEITSCIFD